MRLYFCQNIQISIGAFQPKKSKKNFFKKRKFEDRVEPKGIFWSEFADISVTPEDFMLNVLLLRSGLRRIWDYYKKFREYQPCERCGQGYKTF